MTEQEREAWDRHEVLVVRVATGVWTAALAGVASVMISSSGVFTVAVMALAFYLVWRVA